ncbi:MAG: tRNA (adenosine(37)-N6)-threonylcarbamoyltransferase complex dimerization subunit type 1 TsaB [Acholeplasmatales bacterium]|nr:tRNA (adenosine(37)-N6)-threonylcarbamoyltransferase complex dimerization subunit type 1 TsaB [Acholeplasmatales bacterium]
MYSLILDSSTKILYTAIVKDENVVFESYIEGRNDHAKNIVDIIDKGLKKNNIEAKNLDEVVVGYGPGSYTGVRMAVSVAKMISSFMDKPLYTISTLKLMASGSNGIVLSMIDARRNNSFGMIIDMNTNSYIKNEALYPNSELLESKYDVVVNDASYKVDPLYVLKNKELVENKDLLVPNYLRETEAERNQHD